MSTKGSIQLQRIRHGWKLQLSQERTVFVELPKYKDIFSFFFDATNYFFKKIYIYIYDVNSLVLHLSDSVMLI